MVVGSPKRARSLEMVVKFTDILALGTVSLTVGWRFDAGRIRARNKTVNAVIKAAARAVPLTRSVVSDARERSLGCTYQRSQVGDGL